MLWTLWLAGNGSDATGGRQKLDIMLMVIFVVMDMVVAIVWSCLLF